MLKTLKLNSKNRKMCRFTPEQLLRSSQINKRTFGNEVQKKMLNFKR